MNSKTSNASFKTRACITAGAFSASSLGDLKDLPRSSKRLASRLCQTHSWRVARFSRTCSRCGLVEDRQPAP